MTRRIRHFRSNVFIYFYNRVVPVIYRAQPRPQHNCVGFLFRRFIGHFLILDEFVHHKHGEIDAAHRFLLVAVGLNKSIIRRIVFLVKEYGLFAVIVFLDGFFIWVVLCEDEAESFRGV